MNKPNQISQAVARIGVIATETALNKYLIIIVHLLALYRIYYILSKSGHKTNGSPKLLTQVFQR